MVEPTGVAETDPTADRRSGNVVEQVADTLRDQIVSGALAPGMRLSQADVARELKVSRTPLREALHKLEAEGLVVTQANRGMSVAPAPLYQVEDAYALRLLVEPPMVRAIVQTIADEPLSDMSQRLAIMEQDHPSTRNFQDAHFAFHNVITGRYPKAVSRLVNAQVMLINRYQRLYFARPRSLSDFTGADRAFLQAVSRRQGHAAARIMQFHLIDAAIGMIQDVDADYVFDPLIVTSDALEIDLAPREDGRFDISWRDAVEHVELSETSNLVPQTQPARRA